LDEVAADIADTETMVQEVEAAVARVAAKKRIPVVLGGEHTVSVGAVRALAARGKAFVVSFDAHADLRDTYKGTRFSHACFLRRAREVADGCVFGVRSISRDEVDFARTSGTRIFYADRMRGPAKTLDLDFVPRTVYLSIDIDVLDPSLMPATGTPEPGGLGWYDLLDLITRVISGRRVVGFDVVELSPLAGNHAPDFAAAKLVHKVMGSIAKYASTEDDRTSHG
jgi:agmatinase